MDADEYVRASRERTRVEDRNRLIGWSVIVGTIIAMAVGGAIWGLTTYNGEPYTINQARGFIDLAASTNNLTETLDDLNQTLVLLAPIHGNPELIFPTAHTNIDAVKRQIQTTIQSGLKVLGSGPASFAYQQALKNIQSDLTTTVDIELKDISGTMVWYRFLGLYLLMWVIVVIGLFVIGAVTLG